MLFPKVAFVRTSLAAVATAALLAVPAAAVTIASSAYGLSVNLAVTPAIGVGIGPVAPSGSTAAPAYNVTNTVLAVNQTLGLGGSGVLSFGQGVGTGIITTSATSAFPVNPTGSANATVNNLALALVATSSLPFVGPVSLLSIGADTLVSDSSVEGFGTPSATGNANLTGLTLGGTALGGLVIDGSLFANPAANTELLNLLGLRIVLNEQIPSGDNVSTAGIATNALHVAFTNFLLGTNLLNGDIIVSHSQASIAGVAAVPGVPEPATWIEMIAGLALVGVVARRRQGRSVAA